MLESFNLPRIDPEEDEKMLDALPHEIKQKEIEEYKKRKKKEQKEKYRAMIKESEKLILRKGSKRYWRAVTRSLMNALKLYRESIKNKIAMRDQTIQDLDEAIKLYNDVAKGWLMKCIRKPLMSIL